MVLKRLHCFKINLNNTTRYPRKELTAACGSFLLVLLLVLLMNSHAVHLIKEIMVHECLFTKLRGGLIEQSIPAFEEKICISRTDSVSRTFKKLESEKEAPVLKAIFVFYTICYSMENSFENYISKRNDT